MNFWTQLSDRDRRALSLLAAALLVTGLVFYWPEASTATGTGTTGDATEDSLEAAQRRRLRLQQIAATIPTKQNTLKRAQADLAEREKGIIQADTPAQAQAQLLQTLRLVGRQQSPPLEVRGEGGTVAPLGDAYGLVSVNIAADCPVETLVNFLTDLTRQKDILATQEVRVAATQSKQKTLSVRMTVAGVVPKRLAPEKKGAFR